MMKRKYTYLIVILLIIVSFIAFGRIAGNDFINSDDDQYITENNHIKSGLNEESIKWAFTTIHFTYWHPLTWLSHMLDWSLFGTDASSHHLVSLFLHIGAVLFLFLFLKKATNNILPSFFAAALFALHPLRVESVAWATERKDVLSMFFGMTTLYIYVFYTKKQNLPLYILTLIFFIFGLMSKPIMVTLPFVLLLIDYWPLERWPKKIHQANIKVVRRIILEKLPFIFLTILLSIVTFSSQNINDLVISNEQLPLITRIVNAIISYIAYLEKFFWPINLAVFYPYPDFFMPQQIISFLFILTGITITVIYFSKKYPFLFTGWLWYLGTFIPMIGLVQVGAQAMADRHTYLPSIGIAIIVAWGIPSIIENQKLRRKILSPAAIIFITLMLILTWKQCGYWKNSITLFSHALQVTKNNHLAHSNLATALLAEGRKEEAINNYRQAILIKPNSALPYNMLGNAYTKLGWYELAIQQYNHAIRLNPTYENAFNNRGTAYSSLKQTEIAIKDFNYAIYIKPDYADAYYNRGTVYMELGQYQKAVQDFSEAIRIKPDYISAYYNRAIVYSKLRRYQSAIEDYSQIIRWRPDYAVAYNNRAAIYLNLGNNELGCQDARKACEFGTCKILAIVERNGICR
ncbi:MAG: tetratricopeptide repeat protein [Syntrophaceae bacterium]|nr:tetratricopeptide repeat protein [Syntrophaceae bacterium]